MRNLFLALVMTGWALGSATAADLRSGVNTVRPRPPEQGDATANGGGQARKSIPADATEVRFYGQAFLYLTTSSGVRIAFNPFGGDAPTGYEFPDALPADIVLISAESPDLSASEGFTGLPQIFRSLTGLGANNANGIAFRGVATSRDADGQRHSRANTVYVLELDRVVFCNLGAIGRPLDQRQARAIGGADVLFLPVGNRNVSVADLWKIVGQTRAKWVVPVLYRTARSTPAYVELRTLDEFLSAPESSAYPRVRLESNDYVFTYKELPPEATLLLFQSP
ncbi:MAG: MBL fold metallo-hydrolase [Verrucomicrobiales bacterium]|jgi:L-ascorbate metabolism protein UlaG (beta-lactamase superfamily)|nr:MBL fold metallo-hydrolase [Verrucomicrobiales bacterium]